MPPETPSAGGCRQQTQEGVLRAAVIGVGYLGRIHAMKYQNIPQVELVAVVDAHAERAHQVGTELRVAWSTDYTHILDQVDLVSVVTPTRDHFAVASACLQAGIHVLVEKPITTTLEEADALISRAKQSGRVLQVGHLKRFHPTVVALNQNGLLQTPRFIDAARLAPFKARSLDVDVVADLMIHDIDLVCHFVPSPIVAVDAAGIQVVTEHVDVANARLRFQNGCVANLTASRVAKEATRRLRLFQKDALISLDFIKGELAVMRRGAANQITVEETSLPVQNYDTLEAEITAFCTAVRLGQPPLVSGDDGRKALQIVMQINQAICHSS